MTRACMFLLVIHFCSCSIRDKKQDAPPPNPFAGAKALISEGMTLLQDGDLVLRNGQEISSQLIRQFSRQDQSYSHSGIVFYENGYPYVYHIVPGEENPDGRLKADSFSHFCNPRKNDRFAIYRYDLNDSELNRFHQQVLSWYAAGIRYDSSFNLATDDRMYCSEMIRKGLKAATHGRVDIPTSTVTEKEARFFASYLHRPVGKIAGMQVVAADNLYLNPHCRLVKRFELYPKP
jgi:Permuted papain-like amidase enzyme, YaeF/YiiX, C92 family